MTWWRRPRSPPGTPASNHPTRCKRSGGAIDHLAMAAGDNKNTLTKLTEEV